MGAGIKVQATLQRYKSALPDSPCQRRESCLDKKWFRKRIKYPFCSVWQADYFSRAHCAGPARPLLH